MTARRFPAVACALALGGCTVGPDFHAPAPPVATGYLGPGEATATISAAASAPRPVPGGGPAIRWWEAFGSPALSALVDRAIANNASLAASDATLAQARARVDAIAGIRRPQIDVNSRIEREQVNLSAFGFDGSAFPGVGNPQFDLYTVGGGVSFDLDLFGGNRRRLEQVRAQAEAQALQTEAAHLTLAGQVVNQVLTVAALRARIATVNVLLSGDARLVDLTEARRRGGEGTLVEVLNVRSQLADDRGDLPQLAQQLDEARHLLATLVGVAPAELGPTDFDLAGFTLPREVPVAVPSRLVRLRPDILQAEADLHAATAAIGVATAALYPDVTLGATGSRAAPRIADIFSPDFGAYDLFAGLSAPIFRGGTLRAERAGAVAAARASAASYRATVLRSFQQIADLLDALRNDAQAIANQEGAADVATRNRDLSQRSFKVGNAGILTVLDSERLYQRAQLALVDAHGRQALDIARLYVATAGGWSGPAIATATR